MIASALKKKFVFIVSALTKTLAICLCTGVLIGGSGCADTSSRNNRYSQISEINFVSSQKPYSGPEKSIHSPEVVELFADDLDYDKYEKENAKQEYYKLADFQGYYQAMIEPLLHRLNINNTRLNSKNIRLNFITAQGVVYTLDCGSIKSKQGLILFNGRDEPVFWMGYEIDGLEKFVQEFFHPFES